MKANYPAEFLAASMTLEMANTDKIAEFRREALRIEHSGRLRLGQRFGGDLCRQGWAHPLFARGDQGGRPSGGRASGRGARRQAVHRPRRFRRAASIRASSTSGRWKALSRPALSTNWSRTGRGCSPGWTAFSVAPRVPRTTLAAGQDELFGGVAAAEASSLPDVPPWLPAERLQREYACSRLLSVAPIRSTNMMAVLAADARPALGRFRRGRACRRHGRPACRHRDRQAGAAYPHRRTDGHRPALRSVGPVRGGALLRGAGRISRPPGGRPVGRRSGCRPRTGRRAINLRCRSGTVGAKRSTGPGKGRTVCSSLRVFIRDDQPLRDPGEAAGGDAGKGEVSLVLLVAEGEREVEIRLPGGFAVSPRARRRGPRRFTASIRSSSSEPGAKGRSVRLASAISGPYKAPIPHAGSRVPAGGRPPTDNPSGAERLGGESCAPAEVETGKGAATRHGYARFFYAPAARSWRPFRPPEAPLEPEDGGRTSSASATTSTSSISPRRCRCCTARCRR